MKNKKFFYLILTTLLICFGISMINNNNLVLQASSKIPFLKLTSKNISEKSVNANMPVVAEHTKFIFKIKYKDSEIRNMVLEKHFNESTLLNSKTQIQLNEFFKNQGYTVSNMNGDEIVFVNNSDRYGYSANRYFLGVYNNLVTIYKTDNNGNITAQKIFNSNVYAEDGTQKEYNFETKDSGELQYIKIDDLKEKDGLVEDLIRGRKHTKDIDDNQAIDVDKEYENGEFKTPGKAFDYARGLLKS